MYNLLYTKHKKLFNESHHINLYDILKNYLFCEEMSIMKNKLSNPHA